VSETIQRQPKKPLTGKGKECGCCLQPSFHAWSCLHIGEMRNCRLPGYKKTQQCPITDRMNVTIGTWQVVRLHGGLLHARLQYPHLHWLFLLLHRSAGDTHSSPSRKIASIVIVASCTSSPPPREFSSSHFRLCILICRKPTSSSSSDSMKKASASSTAEGEPRP